MKFASVQLIQQPDVQAATVYFLWIFNIGTVINHSGNRTDIFFTLGIMPLSISIAFGLTHL